jgi:hypothetical protein
MSSRRRSSSSSSDKPNDDESFVTVIIYSHGRDLRSDRATDVQKNTLRKLTVPGKGMLGWHGAENLMPSIFYGAHVLSKNPHIPFTEKLKLLSNYLYTLGHNDSLQNLYEKNSEPYRKISNASTKNDWFLTSKVTYNHLYVFSVNEESNPWERDAFGIWLMDGSEHVLRTVDFDPTKEKNNIMREIGLPVWPLKKDDLPTEKYEFSTTIFDLEKRLKTRYNVKHVNFIDMSCRHSPKTLFKRAFSWFVNSSDDDDMDDVHDEILEQATVGGVVVEILKKQPQRLPSDWKYVKIPRNGEYVYANIETGEISRYFPEAELTLRPRKRPFRQFDPAKPPSIAGVRPMELPLGWEYLHDPLTDTSFYVNKEMKMVNPVVPRPPSTYGGKFAKSRKRKCLRPNPNPNKNANSTAYEK